LIKVRIVLHMASGAKLQTEEEFSEQDDFEEELHEALSKRGSTDPWRYIGHILVHPANVFAMEVEAVNVGTSPREES